MSERKMLSGIWWCTWFLSRCILFLFFFFFQNRLQAKVIFCDYPGPNLTFTDITILGMDKEPTNFTVSSSSSFLAISKPPYDPLSKVWDCSIISALIRSPGLRFVQPALPCSFDLRQLLAHCKIYTITRKLQENHKHAKYEPLNFICIAICRRQRGLSLWDKALLLWADLKLDLLIPDVMWWKCNSILWTRSGEYWHICLPIWVKDSLFET